MDDRSTSGLPFVIDQDGLRDGFDPAYASKPFALAPPGQRGLA